jgi:hypothetical protein
LRGTSLKTTFQEELLFSPNPAGPDTNLTLPTYLQYRLTLDIEDNYLKCANKKGRAHL